MATLIEDVARLKGLEDAAEPGWSKGDRGSIYCAKSPNRYPLMMPYGINANAPEIELAVALRNAAPALLDALDFRHGDAVILGCFLEFMKFYNPNGHLDDRGDGAKITNRQAVECLQRLTEMACKMEAKRE